MSTLINDLKFACRMLAKRPGFTAIALITLAIGIGANTLMFSVVNALLLRPLNKDAQQLVGCSARGAPYFPYSIYVEMRDNNPVFTALMGQDLEVVTMEQGRIARRKFAMFVSSNYFSTLGVMPARGRGFLPVEERLGTEPVVVLSHRAWQRQGADPDIVGTQVSINGTLCQVVGIAPERFSGTGLSGPDIWLPLGVYGILCGDSKAKGTQTSIDQEYPGLRLVGRLKPGLSMSIAGEQMQPLAAHLRQNFQWWKKRDIGAFYVNRLPRLAAVGSDDRAGLTGVGLFLMGVAAIVLLIACLNLANMYVIQGVSRRREIAIRMAIGGGRGRIVRQLLVESSLLAVLGGAFGLVLAYWGTSIVNATLGAMRSSIEFGVAIKTSLDLRVFAATLGFCMIAALLSGLKPALRLSRRDVISDLKESPRGVFRSTGKTRRVMPRGLSVAWQIALSVVLVMGAGLFTHSAWRAAHMAPGYSFEGKLLVEVDSRAAGYDDTQSQQVCERLIDHFGSMPEVRAVGLSTGVPFGSGQTVWSMAEYRPGSEADTGVGGRRVKSIVNSIGGDYFQSMGLALLRGRHLTHLESATNAAVAIIDEPLARRLRPDGNALGCLISKAGSASREVIGIVPGVRHNIFEKEPQPHVYIPLAHGSDSLYIHLRLANTTQAAKDTLLRRVPEEIRVVDPRILVLSATTLSNRHRNDIFTWLVGIVARLAVVFGAMALFLAALGIYGVKGYMVASRTREIGIRMALGATRRDILIMVLREGAALTLAGLSVGMLLALATARVMSRVLCDVSSVDPVSIVVTLILLGGVSLLAGYIPARRAAKVDPMEALRYE